MIKIKTDFSFSEQVELPAVASVSASVIKSPSDPSHVSVPPPPLLLPAATTRSNSTSVPSSIPSIENKPPQAIVKPQILTHVIEGFVIQEGLEPFPVSSKQICIFKNYSCSIIFKCSVLFFNKLLVILFQKSCRGARVAPVG